MSNESEPKQDAPKDFDVRISQKGNPTIVTVKMDVPEDAKQASVVARITSYALRDEVYHMADQLGLSGYGVSVHGPYRVITDTGERSGKVVAYERDFKFTKNL